MPQNAIQREQEETVKEKNCLDINTQFYTNYSVTESGNNVTVSVPSPSEDKYEIIAASYSNGVLTNAAKKSKSDVTSDKTVTFENNKENENDTVKVFVWNSIDGLQPLSDNKAFQIRTGDKVKVKTSVTTTLRRSSLFHYKLFLLTKTESSPMLYRRLIL